MYNQSQEYQYLITQLRTNKDILNVLNYDISILYNLIKEKGRLIDEIENKNDQLNTRINALGGNNKMVAVNYKPDLDKYNEESMNIKEFNCKYSEYLEKNHYGLDFYDEQVIEFLNNIFDNELTKINNFKFYQIKLKFGRCRFYTNLYKLLGEEGTNIERNSITCSS